MVDKSIKIKCTCVCEISKHACSGIMRTSNSDPISEATPSCWYRRTIAMMIRNGADHSP